jgi:hypothetical protein
MGRREQSLSECYEGAATVISDALSILERPVPDDIDDEERVELLNKIIDDALSRLRDFY